MQKLVGGVRCHGLVGAAHRFGNSYILRRIFPYVISIVFSTGLAIDPTWALTLEQASSHCRDTVGRQIVRDCMGSVFGRKSGADLEACKAKAKPSVMACIMKALNAANGRANIPLAI